MKKIVNQTSLAILFLFFGSTQGMDTCFTSLYFGNQEAPKEYQSMLKEIQNKACYKEEIRLKVINKKTAQRLKQNGNKAVAFVSPNSSNMHLHLKRFKKLPLDKQKKVIAHEIFHLKNKDFQKRCWEKNSWFTLLQTSIPVIALSCMPKISQSLHKRLLSLGFSLFSTSMIKGVYLDNSVWYKTFVLNWYQRQEDRANKDAEKLLRQ